MKTIRMIVKGKVQGVYYRASTKKMADQLHVVGWVKNLSDGNVEISASASEEILEKFIAWCRQGPPGADVKEVILEDKLHESFTDFRIKR